MTEQPKKNGWGRWQNDRTNIIKLHQEPSQWEVALDLDVPSHTQNSPEVQTLMAEMSAAIERTIMGSQYFQREAARLGVKLVGMRIEDC